MRTSNLQRLCMLILALGAVAGISAKAQPRDLNPSGMRRIGTVDEQFESYNIEMLEVTGGNFWKPYRSLAKQTGAPVAGSSGGSAPGGMDPNPYEYRSPVNLANTRLRKMARALGPACVRVSATWANITYFQDTAGPAPKTPPDGFLAFPRAGNNACSQ